MKNSFGWEPNVDTVNLASKFMLSMRNSYGREPNVANFGIMFIVSMRNSFGQKLNVNAVNYGINIHAVSKYTSIGNRSSRRRLVYQATNTIRDLGI